MKKSFKRCFIIMFVLISMVVCSTTTWAASIGMDYTKNGSKKDNLLRPGDELLVNISIKGEEEEKVMAIFGTLDYDDNVLELVKSESDESQADIQIGEKWQIGSLSLKKSAEEGQEAEDAKFLIYAVDEERSEKAVTIKFRAKEQVKKTEAVKVTAKKMTLYNTNYREISGDVADVSVEIKTQAHGTKKVVVVILIVLVLFVLVGVAKILLSKSSRNETTEEKNEEDKKVKDEGTDDNKKAENKEVEHKEEKEKNKEFKKEDKKKIDSDDE